MSERIFSGLFVCEGTSDLPLAEIIETLFIDHGIDVRLSKPDYALLGKVAKDVASRVKAGLRLLGGPVDLVVVHRDADNAGPDERRTEITTAVRDVDDSVRSMPVIPVRMTEAWLLLDESAIRRVAGNPRGKSNLNLPSIRKIESVPDPKQLLQQCIITASDCTGRRRDQVAKRFNEHRRQLLRSIDCSGPITNLPSWQQLVKDIESAAEELGSGNGRGSPDPLR
ncbi:DUF4276 family protein [Nocardia asiatica]|uniref:DUF4276 family protein n=1 Tax=Nocardia asiatica TaxID=209252 RepID=UPI0024563690|nr:DUF4276 family protein [Nocardia asiatica]